MLFKVIEVTFGINLTPAVPVDLLQHIHAIYLPPTPKPAHLSKQIQIS